MGSKPANQGSMGQPKYGPHPMTSSAPKTGNQEAAKSTQKRGVHVKGIGGSKKSF